MSNRKKARFWKDEWLDDQMLQQRRTVNGEEEDLQARVCKYWDEARGWRWELLGGQLQNSTLLKLVSMIIDVRNEVSYLFGWLDQRGGMFTVKIAYQLVIGSAEEKVWVGWNTIWHLKIQQRVREYLVIVTHQDPYKLLEMEERNSGQFQLLEMC